MGCNNSNTNFLELNTIFEVLHQLEIETSKFQLLKFQTDKESKEYELYDNFVNKIKTILRFIKNKPLIYLEERFEKFKIIINKYYYSVLSVNVTEYESANTELEDFIFKMMDYFNGIRESIFEPNNNNNFDIDEDGFK